MTTKTKRWALASVLAGGLTAPAAAAGILTPLGSYERPVQILDHHVDVVINNGFARTEVIQTFFNPNDVDLEAIYAFPVPRSASLSEFAIYVGEYEIQGEVLPKEKARTVYEEERDQGRDAGLAEKNSYQRFEFFVSPVRAQDQVRARFVYYQPIEIDTGIGRYVYPLAEGGTDEQAQQFWTTNDVVEGNLSISLELKSAWPVTEVRAPGFEGDAGVQQLEEGHYKLAIDRPDAQLNRDFVFYYKLADDLPGRLEMMAYRADSKEPGTFMMVLTPGLDLQRLTRGSDYVFILDISGSMEGGKIQTLARGVAQAVGELNPEDRYRIVTFNNHAGELTGRWVSATPENVQRSIQKVEALQAGGSTNMYDGLKLGLRRLDDDRVTSIVLVTDAVTNTGVIEPAAFHKLMRTYDVRVFGFLVGNSANWPLMRAVCDASGGFFARVSTADDLIGQILLAKSKIIHECLHDARLKVSGVKVWGTTGEAIGKVYRGQQLVMFGRYEKPGTARVSLDATLSGADQTYATTIDLPELDTLHPELERLWALDRIEDMQWRMDAGLMSPGEAEHIITSLGV
ncbi:MAG: VIT and vWA domain-containing protein, partial [Planctomycetota bacterium]